MRKPWPKLSETLPFERRPDRCQGCGVGGDALKSWRECDEADLKTPVIVVLCRRCSDAIIEPHPRLYWEVLKGEPLPGAMPVCSDCPHRDGLDCKCPLARFNGGPGLAYEPMPSRVHLCRSPRKLSGWFWLGPPVERCSGKDSADAAS